MEILILIAVGSIAVFWALNRLNKENYNKSHPLDALANTPSVNNKTGDVVDQVASPATEVVQEVKVEAVPESVNSQITDSVTQAQPVKKTRKPRASKVEKAAKQKAAKPVKAAAKKSSVKKSKKV